MRTVALALALAALVVVPTVGAVPPSPDVLLVYRMYDDSSLLAWTPVPEAAYYVVHRGASLDSMAAVAMTREPYFLDTETLDVFDYYGVTASDGTRESEMIWTSTDSSSPGGCVAAGPGGKLSVNVRNCIPY